MSDTLGTETDEHGEALSPGIREQLKRTRELESRAQEADERVTAAERRAVFAEVGIPTEGVGKLFRDAYSGDLTSEAVKEAAEGYGILGGSQNADDGLTDTEREALRRSSGSGPGGLPPQGQDVAAVYLDRIRKANSKEEVMQIVREAEAAHPELGRFTDI